MKNYSEKDANRLQKKLRQGATVQDLKKQAEKAGIPIMTLYNWAKKINIENVTNSGVPAEKIEEIVTKIDDDIDKLSQVYRKISDKVPSIVLQGVTYAEMSLGLANMILIRIANEARQRGREGLEYVSGQEKQLLLADKMANGGARVIKTVHPELETEYAEKMLQVFSRHKPTIDINSTQCFEIVG